jgi:AcrR family transcriptional regulator
VAFDQATQAPERADGAAYEDLTARARIRDAAMRQFTEHGFQRTTIRGIAAAAGVSPGLVRHHFGSKEALREAVDAYVTQEMRRINDEVLADGRRGDLGPAMATRQETIRRVRPHQRYLMRALMDGSVAAAKMFDDMVEMTEQWIAIADAERTDPPPADVRTRAALLNAMKFGVGLLHEHVSRAVGVDIFTPEGDRRVAVAMLDILSHSVMSPDLVASAVAGLDAPPGVRA